MKDRLAGDLLQQRLPALPAVGRAAAVRGAAGTAGARGRRLLHANDAFDLAQLGVCILQRCGALDQHLDPDAVANRHLIDQAAEVPLKFCDAPGELITAAFQIDHQL